MSKLSVIFINSHLMSSDCDPFRASSIGDVRLCECVCVWVCVRVALQCDTSWFTLHTGRGGGPAVVPTSQRIVCVCVRSSYKVCSESGSGFCHSNRQTKQYTPPMHLMTFYLHQMKNLTCCFDTKDICSILNPFQPCFINLTQGYNFGVAYFTPWEKRSVYFLLVISSSPQLDNMS